MTNITIGRYRAPQADIFSLDIAEFVPRHRVFSGWIEPADRSWIIFLDDQSRPALYWAEREESGAVVGEPVELVATPAHENERLVIDAAAERP